MTTQWRPDATVAVARERAAMLARLRSYFAETNTLEVDTPSLSPAAASDTHIESIEARLQLTSRSPHFLHTSPEFAMKRLLAAGYPDIYQVCKVYRDGEAGARHQPEFTMIEWYRRYADLDRIIADSLSVLTAALGDRAPAEATSTLKYRDAFLTCANCDPFEASSDAIAELLEADASLREAVGEDRDAWLDLLHDSRIAPAFPDDRFTVLTHYPASQAALARLSPDDPAVAERFEVFLGRNELVNGYVELTDGNEQRRRVRTDQAARKTLGRKLRPLDNAFLAAIDEGLPACSGVAAGLDRLLMVAMGETDIRRVSTFAYAPPDENLQDDD